MYTITASDSFKGKLLLHSYRLHFVLSGMCITYANFHSTVLSDACAASKRVTHGPGADVFKIPVNRDHCNCALPILLQQSTSRCDGQLSTDRRPHRVQQETAKLKRDNRSSRNSVFEGFCLQTTLVAQGHKGSCSAQVAFVCVDRCHLFTISKAAVVDRVRHAVSTWKIQSCVVFTFEMWLDIPQQNHCRQCSMVIRAWRKSWLLCFNVLHGCVCVCVFYSTELRSLLPSLWLSVEWSTKMLSSSSDSKWMTFQWFF